MFFFTGNKIGKRNNVKNKELKQNLAVFSYVKQKISKRKLLNRSEKFKRKKEKKEKKSKISEKKRKK
jgi:hypothetical protein